MNEYDYLNGILKIDSELTKHIKRLNDIIALITIGTNIHLQKL